jgi:biotin carboxyl carrier protein
VGGSSYPLVVVGDADRVELEVGGEKLVVEGWPSGLGSPPKQGVSVNGEVVSVTLDSRSDRERSLPPGGAPSAPTAPPGAAASPDRPVETTGPGVAVFPPMPGKVVEVRVKEGDVVTSGQLLLVLEAMKMRNEVPSPSAGRVVELRVSAGTNVRTKEPMLRIVPVQP